MDSDEEGDAAATDQEPLAVGKGDVEKGKGSKPKSRQKAAKHDDADSSATQPTKAPATKSTKAQTEDVEDGKTDDGAALPAGDGPDSELQKSCQKIPEKKCYACNKAVSEEEGYVNGGLGGTV